MKITFFFIMLSFSLLMVFYVSLRGWQVLQSFNNLRYWYLGFNIALFLVMMGGLSFQNAIPQTPAKMLAFVGFSYMIVIIYMLMSFIATDVIRLLNLIFHFAPVGMKSLRLWLFVGSLGLIFINMIIGNYKFNHPKVVHLDITSEKPSQKKSIRIVAASDIHLGVSIDKALLKKYVTLINAQKPDVVLFAGDISDRSTQPLIDQNMDEEFRQIIAPKGVFAISGNHEYYSESVNATADYLKKSGIIFLRDSVSLVDDGFYIVGRDDRFNQKRMKLVELVSNLDRTKPVILLDHQPFELEEAEQNNVDLQISGHTHNGQFFPGSLIVKRMYELGHGYLKKGKTNYYVSSGLGIWGPQYRIGTQSEIVVIDLKY